MDEAEPSTSASAKKTRGKSWSEAEEICLIEQVNEREDALFGEIKGCGGKSILRLKTEGWQAFADVLNGRFSNARRERGEIKKKFFNLKQRAKSKIDNIKTQMKKTGGGPAPPDLSTAEEALLNNMEGRPRIMGLDSGFDTDEVIGLHEVTEVFEDHTDTWNADVVDRVTQQSTHKHEKGTKRSADEAILINTKEDTERIKLEQKKLKLEIEYLEKKHKTIEAKTQMINTQNLYFQLKIQSEFGVTLVQNES